MPRFDDDERDEISEEESSSPWQGDGQSEAEASNNSSSEGSEGSPQPRRRGTGRNGGEKHATGARAGGKAKAATQPRRTQARPLPKQHDLALPGESSLDQTVLEWCEQNFAEFTPPCRPCKTWIDTNYPAVFLGTSRRRDWDGEWQVYAVVGNFHCARPVMVAIGRCDFEVTRIEQLSQSQFRVYWETGEITTEPPENIREILDNPQRCQIVYLDPRSQSAPPLKRLKTNEGESRPVIVSQPACAAAPKRVETRAPTQAEREYLNTFISEPSPSSLWEQLLRLYPQDLAQNIAHEHRRQIGDRGPAEMLASPPCEQLSPSLALVVETLLKHTRGFTLLVDSMVFGVCFNVRPDTVRHYLASRRAHANLPPHPLTVLCPLLAKHEESLLSIVRLVPARWVHFLMCDPAVFPYFEELSPELLGDLVALQSELRDAIDFIKVDDADHLSLEENLRMAALGQRRRVPTRARSKRSHAKRVHGRRRHSSSQGFVIDDISAGFGAGPIPVHNDMDDTPFRNVTIIDQVVSRLVFGNRQHVADACQCKARGCGRKSCACWHNLPSKLGVVVRTGGEDRHAKSSQPKLGRTRVSPHGLSMTSGHHAVPFYHEGRVNVHPSTWIVECNEKCSCGPDCGNRVVQHGQHVRMRVVYCGKKGWGVVAAVPIKMGEFVCEYVGELIDSDEAEVRGREYDASLCTTLYDLDAAPSQHKFTLDASHHCSVARFFNHSCDPNLVNYQVLFDHHDVDRPHVSFFAARNIRKGEELTFDYRYPTVKYVLKCECQQPNCRKWLM